MYPTIDIGLISTALAALYISYIPIKDKAKDITFRYGPPINKNTIRGDNINAPKYLLLDFNLPPTFFILHYQIFYLAFDSLL